LLHHLDLALQTQAELEAGKRPCKDCVLTRVQAPFRPAEVGAALRAKPARRVIGAELQTCKHRNVLKACRPTLCGLGIPARRVSFCGEK